MSSSCVIVIREYQAKDGPFVSEVVRNAYLSIVTTSWYNALSREITFQLIIMVAAVLFIFVGVPLHYCIISIPLVLLIIYLLIYTSFFVKASELMLSKRPVQCWVAEAIEPLLFMQQPETTSYRILHNRGASELDTKNYHRKIIGTVAVNQHVRDEESAWIYRLAVRSNYCHKGVGHALVRVVQHWCQMQKYKTLESAISECQEGARQLFVDTGFEIKQLYHKQLIGTFATLLMSQMTCDLNHIIPDI